MATARSGPRMTVPTQLVLRAFLEAFAEDPQRELYGLEVCGLAGLQTGTIHPILARLERFGWLHSSWEQIDPKREGRPRRRYYRLDPNSIATVRAALARAQAATPALRRLRPGVIGGAP
jgi:PadR family transcriptional regulator, regulatory protein PadR